MYEWITILFALMMEATTVTWPDKDLRDRIPGLNKRSVWVLLLAVPMFILSVSYLVFGFVWAISDVLPISLCGSLLVALSLVEMFAMASGRPKNVPLKRLDGAVCFVCLILIGYAKTKGW